jgi:hypothetical protein
MAESKHPVTIAVTRPDGSVEHVRVGIAVRRGETFTVQLAELTIGAFAEPATRRPAAPAAPPAGGGVAVFPNYGRSKGAAIAGATTQDLEYYAAGARRTLADPNKARFHDKERQLLAAIEAELARQGGGGAPRDDYAPPRGDDAPPRDEDGPPPRDDDDLWRP